MFRFVEHTAELGIELEAPTREELLAEAAAALGELVGDGDCDGEPDEHRVRATGRDDAALLVAWLDELLFLVETEDFVPASVTALSLADGAVDATVAGRRDRPRHLVKAVTYERLEVRRDGDRWRAFCVVDV